MQQGVNSDPITLKDGSVVVIRLHQHTPAAEKPYAQVENQVAQAYRQQQALAMAKQYASTLVTKLNKQQPVALSWQQVSQAKMTDKQHSQKLMQAVFDQPLVAKDHPVAFTVVTDSSHVAIVQLQAVTLPSANELAETKAQVKQRLLKYMQRVQAELMQDSITQHSKIKINKEALN